MSGRLLSRPGVEFLLDGRGVDGQPTGQRFAEHSRDTVEAMMDASVALADESFPPDNAMSASALAHAGFIWTRLAMSSPPGCGWTKSSRSPVETTDSRGGLP